jgi:hypothetical protein
LCQHYSPGCNHDQGDEKREPETTIDERATSVKEGAHDIFPGQTVIEANESKTTRGL